MAFSRQFSTEKDPQFVPRPGGMRKSGGTSKEGVKTALDLGLRIQGGKITGIAILGKQRRPRELVLHAGYTPSQAQAGGGLPPPRGEHRRPPAFLLWHFGVIVFFGVSRSMRSWQHGYVQRGRERERERERERDIYIYMQSNRGASSSG